jgi:stage IV sporulation protein B
MKILKKVMIIIFLLLILIYVTNITAMPDNILLFKGEKPDLGVVFGVFLKENESDYETIATSTSIENVETMQKSTIQLSLFNLFDVKKIEVSTIPNTTVIPLGNTIGLKLYATGVLVVGMTEIEGRKPYQNSGIQEGDMIVKVNEKKIASTNELIECVNGSNGSSLEVVYIRDGEEVQTNIEPTKTTSNEYKLGLWVRDGAARNSVRQHIMKQKLTNLQLCGHGIVDVDTEGLIKIASGELVTSSITSIIKGKGGNPRRNKRNSAK